MRDVAWTTGIFACDKRQGERLRQTEERQAAQENGEVEPGADVGPPVAVLTACPPDTLPADLLAIALDELKARGEGGGLIAGYPLTGSSSLYSRHGHL